MPVVSDLFTLQYGHSLELNRLEQSDSADAINFVSRTVRNNGVSARVRPIDGLEPARAGTLSVALGGQGGACETFLQPFPYYCGRDVMVLTSKKNMPQYEKLWWATCISANRFRFGFGRQANRTLKDLVLPEPKTMPEWVPLVEVDCFEGSKLPFADTPVAPLHPLSWKRYELSELFSFRKGKRLTKANMAHGVVPYIGAIDKNNGISAFVAGAIHDGNTITVNYDGNVLYPKFTLSPAIALFIATVIRLERYRFSYGRKWHLDRMQSTVIRLPAGHDGTPDWKYMEEYIRSLPFSSQIG